MQTQSNEHSLYRVLRALTTINLFRESKEGFHLTELSRYLLSNDPDSVRALALMRGEEVNWKPWGELLHAVKTGESAFEKVFGTDLFGYYEQHPRSGQRFNEGMNLTTKHDIQSILESYDFSSAQTIVEVGGGLGRFLYSILDKYPNKQGILFDLPHVVQDAPALCKQFKVEDRCKIVGGHFFESVPTEGDLYILKRIVHDWDDKRSIQILQNCRKAMPNTGKVLLCEMMVQDDFNDPQGKVNDVHMMVVTPGGKERTKKEFSHLLESSGFVLTRTIQAKEGLWIIEGQAK